MRATRVLTMAAAAFLFLADTGCQYNPYANRFTTVKPLEQDLPGAYIICDQTVMAEVLRFPRGQRGRIELRADGTFTATNFPVWEGPDLGSRRLKRLEGRAGRWRLEGNTGQQTTWEISFEQNSGREVSLWRLDLTSDRPPYGLIDTIGDPDMGQVVIFEREGTSKAEQAKRP